ncbi:MAG: 3-phosphoshikimate 1-carboxyvinyltransferase [Verrucomicrobiales bacterium]|nr:3-phosphoshikimate 1-carboxyvinyltransferase [Verrucomicrobiales bacterium]
MPLPSLIEIVPLTVPAHAEITVPGSKSITNRALVLAALAQGEVRLEGALWSEDTQVMVECLRELGFMVNVEPDAQEIGNRTITAYGRGGVVPRGGTEEQPLELFVGNAGTAARFLTAMLCLGSGVYRLQGVPRMHERPQAALFDALRQRGYRIDSPNDKLPALIHGGGRRPGDCQIRIEESSQFASALLLCAGIGGWAVEVLGENAEESPYVFMTIELIKAFPTNGGTFQIEPDASSASYFLGAAHWMIESSPSDGFSGGGPGSSLSYTRNPTVHIARAPRSGWQIDANFSDEFANLIHISPHFEYVPEGASESFRRRFNSFVEECRNRSLDQAPVVISRGPGLAPGVIPAAEAPRKYLNQYFRLGDSIMTAITLAPLAIRPARFVHLARLRLQECDRVLALRTELAKCGARVIETGDTLEVFPSELHGAEIETYDDHRMAMCFAILGLKVPGIRLKNPACVKKTFPNFFQKLAAPPPHGLGAKILHGATRRTLSHENLFAD